VHLGAELGMKSFFVTRYHYRESLLLLFTITLVFESTSNDVMSNDLVLYICQSNAFHSC
jgi:hypothetical protein